MKDIANAKRLVFKIGSSTLTYDNGKLNIGRIDLIARTLADLKNSGREIVIVSSGAVSAGMGRLDLEERPSSTTAKQALSAVGQSELMGIWSRIFSTYGHTVAQILITKDEIKNPKVYENARNTFNTLIGMKCIPIVNENDSMSYEEIEFGDNDTLSAHVSLICSADALVILSDIDGLFSDDPHKNPDAKLIPLVDEITEDIVSAAKGAGSKHGTGGLVTKIHAAEIVMPAGIPMYIINGSDHHNISRLAHGENIGTAFIPKQ